MTDTKQTMTNWDRIKRVGPGNEYLFCSTAKLDDPDGSWLKAFCKEARENGCTAYVAPGVGYLYVVVGTEVQWTGVCPDCNQKTVTGGRCTMCGWDSGQRTKTTGYTIPGGPGDEALRGPARRWDVHPEPMLRRGVVGSRSLGTLLLRGLATSPRCKLRDGHHG